MANPANFPNPGADKQGFPQDLQICWENLVLRDVWRYFFYSIWQRLGAGVVAIADAIYFFLGLNAKGEAVLFMQPVLGGGAPVQIPFTVSVSPPAVQSLVVSPWIFTAPQSGLLTVSGGRLEMSRDGGVNWYLVGLVGGALTLHHGDAARVSWFNPAGPPDPVVWWQGGMNEP